MDQQQQQLKSLVVHSGFLTKQGERVRNWKVRWFILKYDSLSYYTTNLNWQTTKPKGIIPITRNTEVNYTLCKNRNNCFTICNPPDNNNNNNTSNNSTTNSSSSSSSSGSSGSNARVYLISCQTVIDQKKWVDMVKKVISGRISTTTSPTTTISPLSFINSTINNTSATTDDALLSRSLTTSSAAPSSSLADQLSSSLKDLAVSWKRKESFAQAPSLLTHQRSQESVSSTMKVSLSKRKLRFLQENLDIPYLAYGDVQPPDEILEQTYNNLGDNLEKKQNRHGVQRNRPIPIVASNNNNNHHHHHHHNVTQTSPTGSSSGSSSSSSGGSASSTPSTSSTPSASSTPSSPSSPVNSSSPPNNNNNNSNNNNSSSPFYKPYTLLNRNNRSPTIFNPPPTLQLNDNNNNNTTTTNTNNNNNTNNTTITPITSLTPSKFTPTKPTKPALQQQQQQQQQPKILVYHLAKDYFQIHNIGQSPIQYEILSPFDINYTISFEPASGTIPIGSSITIQVELVVYNAISIDIYSTIHIKGGIEFTLFSHIDTDPILPLFLLACSGTVLNGIEQEIMLQFMKEKPDLIKPVQELAHQMILSGRNINPKTQSPPPLHLKHANQILTGHKSVHNNNSNNIIDSDSSGENGDGSNGIGGGDGQINGAPPKSPRKSGIRLTKHVLYFQQRGGAGGSAVKPISIYQLLNDKFLLSNSTDKDASFQFYINSHRRANNGGTNAAAKSTPPFKLSFVPMNGVLAKGEWFTIRCSLTMFEEMELNEVVQLVINSKQVYYLLIQVKASGIHPGNKEIDVEREITLQHKLGMGAAGDVYMGLMSANNLKLHVSRISFEQCKWLRRSPSDLNIMVAVKLLHQFQEPSTEIVQDFFNEIQTLSILNHPNVVKYIGGCTVIGKWAIIMEYLPGGSLYDVLHDRIIDLPYRLLLRMALDIAKGIHYLHSLGILHLDLKSPNLLISSLSLTARVHLKVADFNTCINRGRLTGLFAPKRYSEPLKGTTAWMAPEIIRRSGIYTEKVDVYSFGVILWEMITRELPYAHLRFNSQVEEMVLRGERPPIPNICPPDYRQLMESCWSDDPTARPMFDQIIHSLTLMLQQHEIQEQKAKSSFRGLRRVHSGSSIFIQPQSLTSGESPKMIVNDDNVEILVDNNNTTTTTSTTSTTSSPSPDSVKQRRNATNNLLDNILDDSKMMMSTITINNNNNNRDNNRDNRPTPITASKSNSKSKLYLKLNRPKSSTISSSSFLLLQQQQQQQNDDNNRDNSSITNKQSSTLSKVDSNLPFKFSPPSSPQNSSFLGKKTTKIDEDLILQNEKEKRNSIALMFKPSFTSIPFKSSISQNHNNSNNKNNKK